MFCLYTQLTEEKENSVRSKIIKHCIPQGTNAILFPHSSWSSILPYQVSSHANDACASVLEYGLRAASANPCIYTCTSQTE